MKTRVVKDFTQGRDIYRVEKYAFDAAVYGATDWHWFFLDVFTNLEDAKACAKAYAFRTDVPTKIVAEYGSDNP